MKNTVRIIVIGDPSTGKTSIINTLLKECWQDELPGVLPPFTVTDADKIQVTIIDTPGTRTPLDMAADFGRADVVLVVYSIDDPATLNSVSTKWLPGLQDIGCQLPVVLVGNKIDLRSQEENTAELENSILPLMNVFSEIETCIECSAKAMFNIPEVFFHAQKAVLYPTAPIYDIRDHKLKPPCERALRRIFYLCDKDGDGALNDDELNAFQLFCFNQPLKSSEIQGVKDVVSSSVEGGLTDAGLTLLGFVFLHTLFIHKGRVETTWSVLRKYGYDDSLQLRLPTEEKAPSVPKTRGEVYEITDTGIKFLSDIFRRYDTDKDGLLGEKDLANLWVDSESDLWGPFSDLAETVETRRGGKLPLNGFLSRWTMTTASDPQATLRTLRYLGIPDQQLSAAVRTVPRIRTKKVEKRKPRRVYNVFVIGAPQVGKSSLLDAFINKGFRPNYVPTTKHRTVCNSVTIDDIKLYIMLHELSFEERERIPYENGSTSSGDSHAFRGCDLVCLLFDRPSFSYVARIQPLIPRRIPRLLVSTKIDLPSAPADLPPDADSPLEYCDRYGIPDPLDYTALDEDIESFFKPLARVLLTPEVAQPRKVVSSSTYTKQLAVATAVGVLVIAAVGLYKLRRA